MRAIVLTSRHPRHAYLAATIAGRFDLQLVIRESKGPYYTSGEERSPFVAEHFRRLESAERDYFGDASWPPVATEDCAKSAINDPVLVATAAAADPDIVFLFGTSILSNGWLDRFPDRIANLHLGLSPFYRGAATLFWPVARGELECVGATIHLAEPRVDAGRILARVKPRLAVGDTYYDISNKTIRAAIDRLPDVATSYLHGEITPLTQDLALGSVYRKRDFNEAALRAALDFVGSGLTEDQVHNLSRSSRCIC